MSRTSNPPRARRRPQPQTWKPTRDRREIAITVGVVAAIVLGTALVVWMLRPSPSTPMENDAGWLARQARIAWFAVIVAVVAFTVWTAVRHFGRRLSTVVAASTTVVVTGIVAILLGFFWPDGLVNPGVPEVTPPPGAQPDPGPLPAGKEPFPTAPTAPTDPAPPATGNDEAPSSDEPAVDDGDSGATETTAPG